MADDRAAESKPRGADWAGEWRSFAGLWAAPIVAMLLAMLLPPAARGITWTLALVWMGVACLLNAHRCGRTHCKVTGPFFLGMAVAVAGYAAGVLPLGSNGWTVLAVVGLGGFTILWWGSERLFGRFTPPRRAQTRRR